MPRLLRRSLTSPWVLWSLLLVAVLLLAQVFTSSLAISLLSQMGIAIIACLSYNMLMGQGGMLSFGHAVFSGLGAYMTIHALNAVAAGALPVPVSLLPVVGGVAGAAVALLLGFFTTRKAGTSFAMITLGLGELVFALALMNSGLFGGEAGIAANRVVGPAVGGISFGPAVQVYYLIAIYTVLCVAGMYAFTRTPLGRLLNAVRDNPERVAFMGYNPHRIRYTVFVIAGFFAGVAGGLSALHFEIVTHDALSAVRSGAYLLFTFVGGTAVFYGPILGGVLMVLAMVLLSELSKAWLLYLGLLFVGMVMFAPGGLASVCALQIRLARQGLLSGLLMGYVALAGPVVLALGGAAVLVEMLYHQQLHASLGEGLQMLGLSLNTRSPDAWFGAVWVLATGSGLGYLVQRQFARQWHAALNDLAHASAKGHAV